jgi:outer membrane biosynthesis protein TonB
MKAQAQKNSFPKRRKGGAGGVPSLESGQTDRSVSFRPRPGVPANLTPLSFANLKSPARTEPRPWFRNFFFWSCFLFLAALIAAPLVFVKSKSPSTETSNPPAPAEKGADAPENNSPTPPAPIKPEEKKAENPPIAPPEKPVPPPPPKPEESLPPKPEKPPFSVPIAPLPKPESPPPPIPIRIGAGKPETSGLSLTQEETLLLEVLRARENGNLKQAKEKALEWLKLSPNSRDAKRLLAEINAALNSR